MTIPHEQIFNEVQLVLQSKIDEFKYFKYDVITIRELWDYCIEKKWRKMKVEEIPLHDIVSTIFSISASEVLGHSQIKQFKENQTLVEINMEEFQELLGIKNNEK